MARIDAGFENSATTRINTGENEFNKTNLMHQNFTVGIGPRYCLNTDRDSFPLGGIGINYKSAYVKRCAISRYAFW